jgi:hypothetical protein
VLESIIRLLEAAANFVKELRSLAEAIGGDWFGLLAGVALCGHIAIKLWPSIQNWLLERQKSQQEHQRLIMNIEAKVQRLRDRDDRKKSAAVMVVDANRKKGRIGS